METHEHLRAMNPERWEQIKDLLEAVLERPPAQRAAFLDEACAGDDALRAEVASLLAAHEDAAAADALDSPFLKPEASRPEGRRVGPYRLVRELGRGGMGTVHLAARADGQFEQQVALKLVHPGAATDEMLRRFRHERQILASLEHPHVARLLDGGVTEDGMPYLVMEYVEGAPLTEYCDAHRLSTEQRLHLFITVCDAVAFAHRNLVVHRDLKPGNIQLSKDGQVKLLDFGIAKLLNVEEVAETLTRTGVRLLTPEYAAPEQVLDKPLTTAADVYALGVILYELLTGYRPFYVRGLSPGEMERVICQEEPTKPSTAVSRGVEVPEADPPEAVSQARNTQPERLRRRLSGDLDNIVLMALRKEPARRYGSAEQLADDVRRHLAHLPVRARPDTVVYRASRFVRRHRLGVAATALVILALVGGIAATAYQARVAQHRFDEVRALANTLLFELHDAIQDLPGSTPARELLVRRSLEYLDKLAREAGSDTSLLLELATAYRKVGDVQGNPTNANLGQTQGALESYRKAVAIAQTVLAASPANVEAQRNLALIQERLGDVQAASGDLEQAEASMRDAVARYRALAASHGPDAVAWRRYAVGLIKLGDLLGNPNFANRGDADAALEAYRTARPLLDSLYAADTSQAQVFRLRGLIYERIGTVYDLQANHEAALDAFGSSLALRQAYAAEHPDQVDAIRDLAIAHEKMGMMSVKTGDLEEAAARYRRSRDIFEDLWQADSMNAQARLSLAISYVHLGDLEGYPEQPNLGRRREALQNYRTALGFIRQVYQRDPANTRTKFWLDLVQERLRTLGG